MVATHARVLPQADQGQAEPGEIARRAQHREAPPQVLLGGVGLPLPVVD
jgi:hypothetical protein